jgi:hypothetical protein
MRSRSNRPRGWRLALTWAFVFPVLAYFTFAVVAGATTPSSTAGAVASVSHDLPNGSVVVVVESSGHDDSLADVLLHRSAQELCTVGTSQLSLLRAHYAVSLSAIHVDGRTITLVTVRGDKLSSNELRAMLGILARDCRLVRVAHVFYLPFDAHGS